MPCEHVNLGDGNFAIICSSRGTRKFCSCGRPGELLCDWKVKDKKSGTCDRPICRQHALEVGKDKHLCQEHQQAYSDWRKRHPQPASPEPQQNLFAEAQP